jgi:hypothetical protein
MLAVNDVNAARTSYERYLLKHNIPRIFWNLAVNEVRFLPYKISRIWEGSKKNNLLRDCSDSDQSSYWLGLNQLIDTWNPSRGDNPDNNFIVFCCEDEKLAQYCMYTLIHKMLSYLIKEKDKPYKLATYRYYELWKLLQLDDFLDIPNVVIIPSVMEEGTPNQFTAFRELLTSSFQVFCCTALGPQAFFNKYKTLPGYLFYVDKVVSMFPIKRM